jgi:MSHA biogenesis protein MshP
MMSERQSGFSLVTAIFLIVIIALVAGFMVTIGSIQKTTSAFSIVGSRAQFAAVSAVEWAAHQVLNVGGGPACFASPTTFAVSGGASGNFNVTLTCTATPVTEGTANYSVFDIDAVAEFGTSGQEDYFSRSISASVTSAP